MNTPKETPKPGAPKKVQSQMMKKLFADIKIITDDYAFVHGIRQFSEPVNDKNLKNNNSL